MPLPARSRSLSLGLSLDLPLSISLVLSPLNLQVDLPLCPLGALLSLVGRVDVIGGTGTRDIEREATEQERYLMVIGKYF